MLLYSVLEYKLENTEIKEEYIDFINDLIEIFSPLFIYYNEEKSKYEWYKEFNDKNLNKLYGYFIYYHEISGKNNESGYYFFRYYSKTSVKCNDIQNENILNDYSEINKNKIINEKMYGFLTFNKEVLYLNQNYIVLKLKKSNDKGKIIRSSASSELNPKNLINFIKKEFKDSWKIIKNNESSHDNKFKLSVLIEILLRKSDKFINGDLLWLYIY